MGVHRGKGVDHLLAMAIVVGLAEAPDIFKDVKWIPQRENKKRICKMCSNECPPKKICCSAEHWRQYIAKSKVMEK